MIGAATYSPVFSTKRAATGLFVSDLWVAAEARGLGLGRRLLATAHKLAAREWGAAYLKLAVYEDNSVGARLLRAARFRQPTPAKPT